MKTRILAAALIAALAQPALAASGAYWNNVDGSFERMLNHQPYAGPTQVSVVLGEIDPVEASLHATMRDTNQPASARAIDLSRDDVGAAFARMLHHTPYAGETGVTVARQMDHRFDRLVLELRNPGRAVIKLAALQQ